MAALLDAQKKGGVIPALFCVPAGPSAALKASAGRWLQAPLALQVVVAIAPTFIVISFPLP